MTEPSFAELLINPGGFMDSWIYPDPAQVSHPPGHAGMTPELTRAPPTCGTTAFRGSEAQISGQESFPKHDADPSPSSTKENTGAIKESISRTPPSPTTASVDPNMKAHQFEKHP